MIAAFRRFEDVETNFGHHISEYATAKRQIFGRSSLTNSLHLASSHGSWATVGGHAKWH